MRSLFALITNDLAPTLETADQAAFLQRLYRLRMDIPVNEIRETEWPAASTAAVGRHANSSLSVWDRHTGTQFLVDRLVALMSVCFQLLQLFGEQSFLPFFFISGQRIEN